MLDIGYDNLEAKIRQRYKDFLLKPRRASGPPKESSKARTPGKLFWVRNSSQARWWEAAASSPDRHYSAARMPRQNSWRQTFSCICSQSNLGPISSRIRMPLAFNRRQILRRWHHVWSGSGLRQHPSAFCIRAMVQTSDDLRWFQMIPSYEILRDFYMKKLRPLMGSGAIVTTDLRVVAHVLSIGSLLMICP